MAKLTDKGLILVFTGNGKGKTTAALGVALRAAGHGLRVLILQFMKKDTTIGEIRALAKTDLPITIRQFGREGFLRTRTCEQMDIHEAHVGLEDFQRSMASMAYDLVILDEINMAIYFGLLELDEVIKIILNRPPHLHLVLTGRNARREIIDIADLVTEMTEIKHHFNQGIKAQKGIEF
jgi:cob(I)alamin adenosyltransferase